jgi:hypothetical protein
MTLLIDYKDLINVKNLRLGCNITLHSDPFIIIIFTRVGGTQDIPCK